MVRSASARIATLTAVVGTGSSGRCHLPSWAAVRRIDRRTSGVDANQGMAATDSWSGYIAPPPARSARSSSWGANNPNGPGIRPTNRGAMSGGGMSATATGSSSQCRIGGWNRNSRSWRMNTGRGRRNGIPPTRSGWWSGRRRRWTRMTVVNVDWVIDPPTTPAAASSVNYIEERPQDLGYEPGKSKGAPVFRYWSEAAVSDLSDTTSDAPGVEQHSRFTAAFESGRFHGTRSRRRARPNPFR